MLRDRNSIFFTGFVLGAIFSYSGMMGFLGGCVTGAIVIRNFGKQINNQININQDWVECAHDPPTPIELETGKDKDPKNYFWTLVKPLQQALK